MSTELIVVSGLAEAAVAEVTDRLLTAPGTAVVHHDLSEVASGVVRRRLRQARSDHTTVLERTSQAGCGDAQQSDAGANPGLLAARHLEWHHLDEHVREFGTGDQMLDLLVRGVHPARRDQLDRHRCTFFA